MQFLCFSEGVALKIPQSPVNFTIYRLFLTICFAGLPYRIFQIYIYIVKIMQAQILDSEVFWVHSRIKCFFLINELLLKVQKNGSTGKYRVRTTPHSVRTVRTVRTQSVRTVLIVRTHSTHGAYCAYAYAYFF